MNSTVYRLWLAVVALAFLAGPPAMGGDPVAEVSKIRKGGPDDWSAAVKTNVVARQAIAAALMEIALDKSVNVEHRIDAVVLMAEIPSREVFDYLLRHLALEFTNRDWVRDDDRLRDRPCRYALSRMDWSVVPYLLFFLEQKRSDTELADLAYVLRKVMGSDTAIALLGAKQQKAASPLRENLEKVVARLTADKG